MKTRSRDQDRTAGIGSVKRPLPGFGAMGETRRYRPFAGQSSNRAVRRFPVIRARAASRGTDVMGNPAQPTTQGTGFDLQTNTTISEIS